MVAQSGSDINNAVQWTICESRNTYTCSLTSTNSPPSIYFLIDYYKFYIQMTDVCTFGKLVV